MVGLFFLPYPMIWVPLFPKNFYLKYLYFPFISLYIPIFPINQNCIDNLRMAQPCVFGLGASTGGIPTYF